MCQALFCALVFYLSILTRFIFSSLISKVQKQAKAKTFQNMKKATVTTQKAAIRALIAIPSDNDNKVYTGNKAVFAILNVFQNSTGRT